MNDGLKDKHRKAIVEILAANPRVERAVLFGSRAMGTHTVTSDVDIALFGDSLTLDDQARLARKIDELPMPQRVDLLRYKTIKDKKLRAQIRKHGVEWWRRGGTEGRGQMGNNGWKEMPFTEAVTVNPSTSMEKGKVYPFVEMAAVDPSTRSVHESEYRKFKSGGARFMAGDTLMARITPCLENGKIARFAPTDAASPGFGSTEFIVIRGREEITTNDFAYYLTKWPEFRQFAIGQMTGTSGRQRVPAQSLAGFTANIPPIELQYAIAHILGTLDDKIELNRRMNRTLEKMAAAIFKSWFIDFDPVRRNATRAQNQPSPGLWPPSPIGRGVGGEGVVNGEAFDHLFPDSFEESKIGLIPKGWAVLPMKELVDVNAKSIKKDYPHGRIRYVDISSVNRGNLDQTTTYDLAEAPSRARRLVQTGDTIWSCVRPNRKAYLYIDQPIDNLVVSTGFAVLSPRAVPPSYLYQWVTTEAFVDYLTAYATGAAYPAVKADTFETAKMIQPSEKVLKAFQDIVGPLRARIAHNQRQNRRLAGLRDTLLPKLLSGEIEVPDADRIVGRCV